MYDKYINTSGFNSKNVLRITGFEEHFPEIIAQVKECVWDIFMDIYSTYHPLSYFLELVGEFYASYVVHHNKHKYKTLITEQPYLSSGLVWGVEVPYTTSKINKICLACDK